MNRCSKFTDRELDTLKHGLQRLISLKHLSFHLERSVDFPTSPSEFTEQLFSNNRLWTRLSESKPSKTHCFNRDFFKNSLVNKFNEISPNNWRRTITDVGLDYLSQGLQKLTALSKLPFDAFGSNSIKFLQVILSIGAKKLPILD